jgi:hypothetical protein
MTEKKEPEWEIQNEKAREFNTVSLITKFLAENPELAVEIAVIFKEVETQKERILVERITNLLAEKVPGVEPEMVKSTFTYWYLVSGQWIHIPPPRPMGQWIH